MCVGLVSIYVCVRTGFDTRQVLQSPDVRHIAGAEKLLRPGRWTITMEPVLKKVSNENSSDESRFPLRQPDG